jgi:hypothetical protein
MVINSGGQALKKMETIKVGVIFIEVPNYFPPKVVRLFLFLIDFDLKSQIEVRNQKITSTGRNIQIFGRELSN